MGQGIFIAGTDTAIGKTTCAVLLIQSLIQAGRRVSAFKPVASGSQYMNGQLKNADAIALQQAMSITADYDHINPYCYEAPISPHLAAAQHNHPPDLLVIEESYQYLESRSDVVIVEGAGGWRSPLAEDFDSADLVDRLNLSVLLVVGLKLGCINHAILSFESMQHKNIKLIGWIANTLDPDLAAIDGIISTLKQRLPVPLLACVPKLEFAAHQQDQLFDVNHLINSGYA